MEDWLPSLPANWTPPRQDLVLDCADLQYIASSGIRILVNLLKTAKAKGDRVVLKNVNEVIRDVLELTGFVSYFVFE